MEQILGTEVEGTTSSYGKVTLSIGAVISSSLLKETRKEALALLMRAYRDSPDEPEKRQILNALEAATRTPHRVQYSDGLLSTVLSDTADVVAFFNEIAPMEQFEILQTIEHQVLWLHRRSQDVIAKTFTDQAIGDEAKRLAAAITAFRATADAMESYVTFKTIVGYESVFPPAWDDDDFEIKGVDDYRKQQIDRIVSGISLENADEWLAVVRRCASTVLRDGATFQYFHVSYGTGGT